MKHMDLMAAYQKAGLEGTKEGGPELEIFELKDLADMMLAGHEDWTNVIFHGPTSGREALEAIKSAPPPNAADAPPELGAPKAEAGEGVAAKGDDAGEVDEADAAEADESEEEPPAAATPADPAKEAPIRSFAVKEPERSGLPAVALFAALLAALLALGAGFYWMQVSAAADASGIADSTDFPEPVEAAVPIEDAAAESAAS